jgi:signal transduction histidine kinase
MISLAVILGITVTHLLLRHILVKEALAQEADYFWSLISNNPEEHLANTKNLRVYLLPRDGKLLPDEVHHLKPGYHEYHHLKDFNVAYVTENNEGDKLLLLFNRSEVDSLVMLFGVIPLSLTLLILYLSLFLSYRYSKKLMSPANLLAEKIRNTNLSDIDKSYFSKSNEMLRTDDEVMVIALAIGDLIKRIESFIEREQRFTQDASHELRSSITVIAMAAELLHKKDLDDASMKLMDKISNAAKDMEELTELFLILAREESFSDTGSIIDLNDILLEEVEKLSLISDKKGIPININANESCQVHAPKKVLSVLMGNLLRNALLYTDSGFITVDISAKKVVIKDTGIGISAEKVDAIFNRFVREDTQGQQGFGVGLSIVKRLCDNFSWDVDLVSKKSQGTAVEVVFG